jgi:hypothetical protein
LATGYPSPRCAVPACANCELGFGIWDRWRDPENDNAELHSCAMVITEPNKFVAEVHGRMPGVAPNGIELHPILEIKFN